MRRVSRTSVYEGVESIVNGVSLGSPQAGSVVGAAAIGKTTAAMDMARTNHLLVYMHVFPSQGTTKAALSMIAAALNVHSRYDSADKIWTALEEHFSWFAETGRILFFDEAQNLDLAILKEIVDFPYRFGLPVVVCGNEALLKRSRGAAAGLDQISTRLVRRVRLERPGADDFQTIAIDHDVYGVDAHKACIAYGLNTSMRELNAVLETARVYAASGPLRLEEIKQAVVQIYNDTSALKLLLSRAA